MIKVGDNISTDTIMPAGNKVLPYRSNIPAISRFVFGQLDPGFADRAEAAGNGSVIGGENYGQGSSREHAALASRYLGIRVKLAKSFARIHKANLVNFGILPLTSVTREITICIKPGDTLTIRGLRGLVSSGADEIPIHAAQRGCHRHAADL